METQMKIPEFKTVQEMAEFWDTHEITEFEDELIEVEESIFKNLKQRVISVILDEDHYTILRKIADQESLNMTSLVNKWVIKLIEEKMAA
jgi:hypothetical protein